MRPKIKPGDVWLVDMGLVAKIRPVLVLTVEPSDDELALVTMISRTTQMREGNPWEIAIAKPWLKPGVFHLQQINSLPVARFERWLGSLTETEMSLIKSKLAERLGL